MSTSSTTIAMGTAANGGDIELLIDGHIVVLRGNVLDTFTANGHHSALLVCHVAVEVKPTRGATT